jgi:arabinofuranosyltransferase
MNAFISIGPGLDDAYIVYRYVVRFLNGEGLTFNDHEYVEGYTSLVWTLLLSLGTHLTAVKPHVVSVVLNYLTIVLSAVALAGLLRILDVPRAWIPAALALMAGSFLYFRVCFVGLELGLFSLLLVLFFCALFSGIRPAAERSPRALAAAGALGGALFGTRPESILLLPLIGILLWVFKRKRGVGRDVVYLGTPWCLAIGAIVLWRLAYYGEWLPNSVIAKSLSLSSADSISRVWREALNGSSYLIQAYTENPGLALIAALFFWRFCASPSRHFEALLLFVPIVVEHVAVLLNGGDWMPYFRFVNVCTPIYLAALFVLTKDWLGQGAKVGLVCVSMFAIVYVPSNARHLEPRIFPEIASVGGWMDLYQKAGEALNPVWVKGDVLIAESIGMLGYAAPDIYVHDPLALTDRNLAHDKKAERNVYGRTNWRYSLSLEPALILLHHWPHQRNWNTFKSGYPERYSFHYIPWTANSPEKCLYVIVRNDREGVYAQALLPLDARKVNYEDIVYPCPLQKDRLG